MQRTLSSAPAALAFTAIVLLLPSASTAQDLTENVTCPRAADIVLALDQSTSIVVGNPDNWDINVLGFAKRIVESFPIDRNLTQIGLFKFSSGVEFVFYLNTYGDRSSVLNAIDAQREQIRGGETNIAAALRTARRTMFTRQNGARNGVPRILILLTDGAANRETEHTLSMAKEAKDAKIIIYTIGISASVEKDQLEKIASKPTYFFFSRNFEQLNSVLRFLIENSCKEAATLPPTTTTTTTTTTATITSPSTTTRTTTTSTATLR